MSELKFTHLLDKEALEAIDRGADGYRDIFEGERRLLNLSIGDIIHVFYKSTTYDTKNYVKCSNKTKLKYQVVYKDSNGFPFFAKITAKGNFGKGLYYGQYHPTLAKHQFDYHDGLLELDGEDLELDTKLIDSVILGETYNPMDEYAVANALRNKITQHNKKHKIPLTDVAKAENFLKSVSIGQVYWTSTAKFFTVLATEKVTKHFINNLCNIDDWYEQSIRDKKELKSLPAKCTKIHIRDSNGKIKTMTVLNTTHKAIYSQQPRSLKEISENI